MRMLAHFYVNDWELYFFYNVFDVNVNIWRRSNDKTSNFHWLTVRDFPSTSLVLQQNNTIRHTQSKKLNLQPSSLRHDYSWLVVITERHSEIYINVVTSDVCYELRLNSTHFLCSWHQDAQRRVCWKFYIKILHEKRYEHVGNNYVSFFLHDQNKRQVYQSWNMLLNSTSHSYD
jgi:hypothetical protein